MRSRPEHLRGFAIVSAIFILVVLAALGAFMVNISTNQQIGSALDVQGVRAYQSAQAGIEWELYQVQSTAAYDFGYASTNPNLRACPAPATTSFVPAAPTLAGFTVTVVCKAVPDPGGFGGPTIYFIQSTACNQPNAAEPKCPNIAAPNSLYIERRLGVAL